MDQPLEFVIGTSAHFVKVAVLERERSADDYWDGNWLVTRSRLLPVHGEASFLGTSEQKN